MVKSIINIVFVLVAWPCEDLQFTNFLLGVCLCNILSILKSLEGVTAHRSSQRNEVVALSSHAIVFVYILNIGDDTRSFC